MALGVSAAFVACSSGTGAEPTGPSDAPAASSTGAASTGAAARTPLALTTDPGRTTVCRVEGVGPVYNVFDARLRAREDLALTSAEVVGERVEQVGAVLTVPPAERGGAIIYSGSSAGRVGASLRGADQLDWRGRADAPGHRYLRGDTALLLARARVDPGPGRPAALTGLTVSYVDVTGQERTETTPLDLTFLDRPC